MFDWFSVRHLMTATITGLILYLLSSCYLFLETVKGFFGVGLFLILLWEATEITCRYSKKNSKILYKVMKMLVPPSSFDDESFLNIFGDILVGLFGLFVVYSIFL